jgi:hypothetical protein
MGQQQLLLIVLGAIIVGIAIIVGLNMFSSGAVQGNIDAVTQDVMTITSRAQEWWRKPAQMGGGGRSWTGIDAVANGEFTGINFPDSTVNGTYTIAIQGDSAIVVTGTGVEIGASGNLIQVQVTASSDNIISTQITP